MRPGDFNCKLRLFRSHDHVGRLVQQQLIGRRRIAALRKLGIDRGNVHHGTVRRYFLVTETAITARTYDIIACEGVDVAIGEPGRAIIERTLVRKLIDPLRSNPENSHRRRYCWRSSWGMYFYTPSRPCRTCFPTLRNGSNAPATHPSASNRKRE